jgi:prepilin-type N-terminal cleavage/methylation domain-containing protein
MIRTHQHGFTLVEVMLAMTMASAIILLAYSAIRTGSKVTSQADRAIMQGNLIMTGYLHAIQADKNTTPVAPYDVDMNIYTLSATPPTNWYEAATATLSMKNGTYLYRTISIVDPGTGVTLTVPVSVTGAK